MTIFITTATPPVYFSANVQSKNERQHLPSAARIAVNVVRGPKRVTHVIDARIQPKEDIP